MRISDWSSDVCSSDLDHDIVLIAAEARLSLDREQPDHVARNVADAEALADRIGTLEQVGGDGAADDAHRLARFLLGRVEDAARLSRPGLDLEIGSGGAVYRRRPVVAAVDSGEAGQIGRAHVRTPVTHSHIVYR